MAGGARLQSRDLLALQAKTRHWSGAPPARSCRQPLLQPGLHRRPIGVDDREEDRIADMAVGHDHVLAEDAFLGGAELGDSGAAAGIARIGLVLDAVEFQRLEGVTYQ